MSPGKAHAEIEWTVVRQINKIFCSARLRISVISSTVINRYQPAEEIVTYMSSFREETLIATLLGVVVPIVQTSTTASAVTDLMKKLNVPDAEKAAVADKIRRYLEMFATVVLQ